MELLLIAVALAGLILTKSLLAGKERHFRNNRAQRKMQRILSDARRNSHIDASTNPDLQSQGKVKPKPPPLPGKEDG